jgi:hypothetical protein
MRHEAPANLSFEFEVSISKLRTEFAGSETGALGRGVLNAEFGTRGG